MQAVWVSMAMFALAGAISPGPVNVIASAQGAAQGFVRALPHVLGATLSYCAVVWLMGSGLQMLLALNPQIAQTTQYVGAAYLLYLAVRIARTQPRAPGAESHIATPLSAWTQGLMQGVLTQSLTHGDVARQHGAVADVLRHLGCCVFCIGSGMGCAGSVDSPLAVACAVPAAVQPGAGRAAGVHGLQHVGADGMTVGLVC